MTGFLFYLHLLHVQMQNESDLADCSDLMSLGMLEIIICLAYLTRYLNQLVRQSELSIAPSCIEILDEDQGGEFGI